MLDEQSNGGAGDSEIAALAERVATARGKLPLQHDSALVDVLSEDEIAAERELAEWIRAQRRGQRRRAVQEELQAEKRDRRSSASIRRVDEADARWHRQALAARRRVSSQDARLAQLYRRAEWSSRALIGVVVLGMVWAGVNVQHNLVPSGDMSDPLYWLSYGIEAMISIPIITIMVVATTSARWGRDLPRGKVVFFEVALLGTTIGLNAGPHLAAGHWGKAAEFSIAPVMVGVVIWLHAWVSARYAQLIDSVAIDDEPSADHGPADHATPPAHTTGRAFEPWSQHEDDSPIPMHKLNHQVAQGFPTAPSGTEPQRNGRTHPKTNGYGSDRHNANGRGTDSHSTNGFDHHAANGYGSNGHVANERGSHAANGHTNDEGGNHGTNGRAANGRGANGHTANGHGPNGHTANGRATNGHDSHTANVHGTNGHAVDEQGGHGSHSTNGHATNGRAARGHNIHAADGHSAGEHGGRASNDYSSNGYAANGHDDRDVNGQADNEHDDHGPDSHSSNGHATNGRASNGQADIHAADDHAASAHDGRAANGYRTNGRTGDEQDSRGNNARAVATENRSRAEDPAPSSTANASGQSTARPEPRPAPVVEQLTLDDDPGPEPRHPRITLDAIAAARDAVEETLDSIPVIEPDEVDGVRAVARAIIERRMSKLPVEQVAEILTLADQSWTPSGIGSEIGIPSAAVSRILDAARKLRNPYAIA
ncbi:hypothetical protein [Nocardia sp. NPDC051832]|uniref:hypothetical protein n=1 Tax=Nocardia sp. NPDC051832 TaxID=3155673 RepID=UPI0034425AC5